MSLNTAFSFDDNGLLATRKSVVEKSDVQKVNLDKEEETGNDLHLNTNVNEHIRSAEHLERNVSEQDSQNCKSKIYHDELEVRRLELVARDTDQVTENLLSYERNNDLICTKQATTDLGGDDCSFTDSGQTDEPSKRDANKTVYDKYKGSGQRYEPSPPVAKETANDKFKDIGETAEPSKPDAKKTLNDTGQSTIISKNVKFEAIVESVMVSIKENVEHFILNAILNDFGIPKKSYSFMECDKNNFHGDAKKEHTHALWGNNHPKDPYLRKTQKTRQEIWSKKPLPSSSTKTSLTKKHWIPLTALEWIRRYTAYFLFAVLFLYLTGVGGTLTEVPLNTIVIRGQTARLTCTTNANQGVYWVRIPTGSSDQQWLYYGNNGFNTINVDDRFSIDKDKSPGRYDLVIVDVQPKDAGQYQCIDELGLGKSAAAELVVVDSMLCGTDSTMTEGVMAYNVFGIKQQSIHLTCNVTYRGNIAPSIIWSWPGSEKQRESPITIEASTSITSKLKLSPTKELNNATFTCQATVNGAANRYNDERLTWKSEPIFVAYAEFEKVAVPDCPGITLNLICNPACSYTFVETENEGCKCQYTYQFGLKDQIHIATSENIACAETETNVPNPGVPIVMGISVTLISVAIVISAFLCVLVFIKKTRIRKLPNSEGVPLPDNAA